VTFDPVYVDAARPEGEADTGVQLAALFGALANDDRLTILRELRLRSMRVSGAANPKGASIDEVAQAADLSRFAASRHLAILREAGLVNATRVGNQKRHRLIPAQLEMLEDWLYQVTDGFTVEDAS